LTALVHQRCWHHADREAVVRCPECRRYYCRECAIEHGRQSSSGIARWTIFALSGFLLAWMAFYYLGMALDRIPSDFFE
jgi:hypothetical protein